MIVVRVNRPFDERSGRVRKTVELSGSGRLAGPQRRFLFTGDPRTLCVRTVKARWMNTAGAVPVAVDRLVAFRVNDRLMFEAPLGVLEAGVEVDGDDFAIAVDDDVGIDVVDMPDGHRDGCIAVTFELEIVGLLRRVLAAVERPTPEL